MAENLKTKKYRTGDIIPTVSLKGAWKILGSGAYCNYNNDEKTTNIYGRLYNWYAINDKRNLAPAGWHVATDSEWKSLIALAGWHGTEKLRESGIMHWEWGDTDYNGTDDFGFTALPGGERYFYTVGSLNFDDIFCYMGSEGYWWTSTDSTSSLAWEYNISILIYRDLSPKQFGFSVRCVKDN
jgi:uncharacterized protein (TIGR02145 family)